MFTDSWPLPLNIPPHVDADYLPPPPPPEDSEAAPQKTHGAVTRTSAKPLANTESTRSRRDISWPPHKPTSEKKQKEMIAWIWYQKHTGTLEAFESFFRSLSAHYKREYVKLNGEKCGPKTKVIKDVGQGTTT